MHSSLSRTSKTKKLIGMLSLSVDWWASPIQHIHLNDFTVPISIDASSFQMKKLWDVFSVAWIGGRRRYSTYNNHSTVPIYIYVSLHEKSEIYFSAIRNFHWRKHGIMSVLASGIDQNSQYYIVNLKDSTVVIYLCAAEFRNVKYVLESILLSQHSIQCRHGRSMIMGVVSTNIRMNDSKQNSLSMSTTPHCHAWLSL